MVRHQRGITFLGFILILVVAGIFALFAMRIGPMFINYNTLQSAVDKVAAGATGANLVEIRKAMDRQMQIDYASVYKPEFVSIKTEGGRTLLVLKYEDRRPLAYNLEIVGKFEHSAPLQGR